MKKAFLAAALTFSGSACAPLAERFDYFLIERKGGSGVSEMCTAEGIPRGLEKEKGAYTCTDKYTGEIKTLDMAQTTISPYPQ